jgi:hypothetical protein
VVGWAQPGPGREPLGGAEGTHVHPDLCDDGRRRDCRKIGGQAAIAVGGYGSLAGWNFCPKPEPSVPL